MKYLIPSILIMLVVLTAGGQQSDDQKQEGIWIGIGPNMEILSLGTYRFIFVPVDTTEQVATTMITIGTGSPGPSPPPDGNLACKVAASLSKVTAADKVATAANLVKVYDSLVQSIENGSLKDAGQVATAVNLLTATSLTGKAGWTDFVSVVGAAMSSSTTVTNSATVLKTISAELKKIQ